MKYKINMTDGYGNIKTGYEEIVDSPTKEEAIDEYIHHHILSVEGPGCHACGQEMIWEDGRYSCSRYMEGDDEHSSWSFVPEAEAITYEKN